MSYVSDRYQQSSPRAPGDNRHARARIMRALTVVKHREVGLRQRPRTKENLPSVKVFATNLLPGAGLSVSVGPADENLIIAYPTKPSNLVASLREGANRA